MFYLNFCNVSAGSAQMTKLQGLQPKDCSACHPWHDPCCSALRLRFSFRLKLKRDFWCKAHGVGHLTCWIPVESRIVRFPWSWCKRNPLAEQLQRMFNCRPGKTGKASRVLGFVLRLFWDFFGKLTGTRFKAACWSRGKKMMSAQIFQVLLRLPPGA